MSSIRVPNPDPSTIVVPGLDVNAPAGDQIEYIDQRITQKLQVELNLSVTNAINVSTEYR